MAIAAWCDDCEKPFIMIHQGPAQERFDLQPTCKIERIENIDQITVICPLCGSIQMANLLTGTMEEKSFMAQLINLAKCWLSQMRHKEKADSQKNKPGNRQPAIQTIKADFKKISP